MPCARTSVQTASRFFISFFTVRTTEKCRGKKTSDPWRELAQSGDVAPFLEEKKRKKILKKPGDPCRGVARCDVRGSVSVPGESLVRGYVSVVLVRGSVSVPGVSQGAGDSLALLSSPSRYTF